jgi:uncharacterized protein YcbX
MLQICELYIYPVKSLPGIAVKQAKVTPTGFEYDRRWMLVDSNNRFITQRECAEMTQLQVGIESSSLVITHRTKKSTITLPLDLNSTVDAGVEVAIWDDTCTAEYVNDDVDQWFSAALGINCRLVYMPDDTRRITDQRYAPEDSITSFADAYPYLIIGQASLDDLNSRLQTALPMNRFRPNIVFSGGSPYQEDLMGNFIVGDVNFYGVKLCARCVMTTIDQGNAAKGKEPLKTLASYRFKNNKILFGQNLIHKGEGVVSVGDRIELISYNDDERFILP